LLDMGQVHEAIGQLRSRQLGKFSPVKLQDTGQESSQAVDDAVHIDRAGGVGAEIAQSALNLTADKAAVIFQIVMDKLLDGRGERRIDLLIQIDALMHQN